VVFSTKKYFLLAVIGALIIGVGTYLFLTSYFERVDVLVAGAVLEEGKKLEEKDLTFKQYYKNSLPEGIIRNKNNAVGKILKVERRTGDPITSEVFEADSKQSFLDKISTGEVLLAISIEYQEPLVKELKAGSIISIISTIKEKDQSVDQGTARGINPNSNTNINTGANPYNPYTNTGINTAVYKDLSENIVVVDSQIVIRNLEIIAIEEQASEQSNILISSKKSSYYIFLKCSISEAPVISRVTKENNYKIIMEKI